MGHFFFFFFFFFWFFFKKINKYSHPFRMPRDNPYLFDLPFPPELNADDLLEKSRNNVSKPGKIPNSFLIYRLSWVEYLKKIGLKLDLPEISTLVGHKWQGETEEVKEFYRQLSTDAKEKLRTMSKARFIFHDKCDFANNEQTQTQEEVASTNSQQTSANNSPGANHFFFTDNSKVNFLSYAEDHQQGIDTMDFCLDIPNEFSFDAIPSSFSSISTISSIPPMTNNLNLHQNCNLKDILNNIFNLFLNSTFPENYCKFHNLTNLTEISEELERIKMVHDHFKSIVTENDSSKNSSKCTMFNHFIAIKEKMSLLEYTTSDSFIGIKN